jgi:hypothetical protein
MPDVPSSRAPFSRLLGPAATINELQSQLREQETMLSCEVLNIGVIEKEDTVKAGAAEKANYAMLRSNIDADLLSPVTVVPVDAVTAADPDAFKTFYTPLIENNTVFDYAIAVVGGEYQNVILMRAGAPANPYQPTGMSVLASTAAGQSVRVKATSFADLADVAAFRRCKNSGKSDKECFKVGDNGIGFMGADCTSGVPMCALPPEIWHKKWGSARNAHLKPVNVTIGGKTVRCVMGDTMPHLGNIRNGAGIDLNPAAVTAFGLKPPIKVDAVWSWA